MAVRLRVRRTSVAAVSLVLGLAVTLTACGGDEEEAGSGDGPIKIGIILPLSSPLLSVPGLEASAKVATKAINDDGGIDGRDLELVVCDDQFDQGAAATCATKLLNEDNVLALAGSLSIVGGSTYPVIEAAGAINFGVYPANADDLSNPTSFPLVNGIAGWNEVSAATFTDPRMEGVKKIAIITAEGAAADAIDAGVTKSGADNGIETVLITHKQDQTDFAPIAAKVEESGADAILLAPNPSQVAPAYAALDAAGLTDLPIVLSGGNNTDAFVEEVAAKGYDPIWGLQFSQDPTVSETRAAYEEQLATYGEEFGGVPDPNIEITVNSWLAIHSLATILRDLPSISREELKKYVESQTAFETGMTNPIDFSQPAYDAYPRGFNKWGMSAQLVDGKMTQPSNEWVEFQE